MDYDEQLAAKIAYPDEWPSFSRPDFINELEKLADKAFQCHNIEGNLSSALIYQQITEEMVRTIIQDAQFLIKIALWQYTEVHWKTLGGNMFGRLLDELNGTIEFPEKYDFISTCQILNKDRIALVHGITQASDLSAIRIRAENVYASYLKLKGQFARIHAWFECLFSTERREMLSVNPLPNRPST